VYHEMGQGAVPWRAIFMVHRKIFPYPVFTHACRGVAFPPVVWRAVRLRRVRGLGGVRARCAVCTHACRGVAFPPVVWRAVRLRRVRGLGGVCRVNRIKRNVLNALGETAGALRYDGYFSYVGRAARLTVWRFGPWLRSPADGMTLWPLGAQPGGRYDALAQGTQAGEALARRQYGRRGPTGQWAPVMATVGRGWLGRLAKRPVPCKQWPWK